MLILSFFFIWPWAFFFHLTCYLLFFSLIFFYLLLSLDIKHLFISSTFLFFSLSLSLFLYLHSLLPLSVNIQYFFLNIHIFVSFSSVRFISLFHILFLVSRKEKDFSSLFFLHTLSFLLLFFILTLWPFLSLSLLYF